MTRNTRSVVLPLGLERSLAEGHRWVYREHVPPGFQAEAGSWVEVTCGAFRGFALFEPSSAIALRIYSETAVPDARWFQAATQRAWELRAAVRSTETDAFRLLNGEGDGMPGIVADVYGPFCVLLAYSPSSETLLPEIARAISKLQRFKGIVGRGSGEPGLRALIGDLPPGSFPIREHGIKHRVELHVGQKTGLFLDHRENRVWLGARCHGQTLLNLFSYTGAFSLHALKGGASSVTSVDLAAPACEAARENFRLNGFDPENHPIVAEDVNKFLAASEKSFDIIVSDPPSFAKEKKQREGALRAYTRLHTLALRRVKPGGLFCAASCTAQIGEDDFLETLARAGREAGVSLQVIHRGGQATDHPWQIGHLESRYLKFYGLRVSRRA